MLPLDDLSLQMLLLDLGFALLMLALGSGAGWLLSPRSASQKASQNAKQAIEKLRELASTVAADVGLHASRMHAINTELTEAQAKGTPTERAMSQTVADIHKANEALQEQLMTAEVRLERQAIELKSHLEASRTDALTGVANRRAFDDELSRRVAEWTRRKTVFSLVMIDVDHFKKFNDKYGHQAGDAVLKGVADTLRETLREMDFLGRYGGEEFAAVLPVTVQKEAIVAAERLRAAVERGTFLYDGTEHHVRCSIGLSQVLPDDTVPQIIKRADAALYQSKSAGRNCIHYHDGRACHFASVDLSLSADANGPASGETALPAVGESLRGGSTFKAISAPRSGEVETGFHADLRRRVAEARKFHVPLSLLMIEIDQFNALGEKFGTETADEIDEIYDTMANSCG